MNTAKEEEYYDMEGEDNDNWADQKDYNDPLN